MIKGVNASEEELKEIGEFVSSLAGEKKEISILPFHNLAEMKHKKMGHSIQLTGMSEPSQAEQKQAIEIFEKYGLKASIGG